MTAVGRWNGYALLTIGGHSELLSQRCTCRLDGPSSRLHHVCEDVVQENHRVLVSSKPGPIRFPKKNQTDQGTHLMSDSTRPKTWRVDLPPPPQSKLSNPMDWGTRKALKLPPAFSPTRGGPLLAATAGLRASWIFLGPLGRRVSSVARLRFCGDDDHGSQGDCFGAGWTGFRVHRWLECLERCHLMGEPSFRSWRVLSSRSWLVGGTVGWVNMGPSRAG